MPPPIEITIPTTSPSPTTPTYTLYNIHLRLPLRTLTISKRYSDFASLHTSLTSQTTKPPPAPFPRKTWFTTTTSNPTLREDRRAALETYLRAINADADSRWRNASAWRAFLNLPTSSSASSVSGAGADARITDSKPDSNKPGDAVVDPGIWLDSYRDMKAHLHDARLHLTRRDQETVPQRQYESSAMAKSSLVRVGAGLAALEAGLKEMGSTGRANGHADGEAGRYKAEGGGVLGEGELRRRKDLLANARKEKDGLENLLNAMTAKRRIDNAVASIQDKEALVGNGNSKKPARSGRVLGRETERTRELDNQGVLQLQKQTMEDQDISVEELRKIVGRQKELGIAINAELEIQNELLKLTDEDADRFVVVIFPRIMLMVHRLQRKVDVGKKRVGKIS